MGVIPVRTITLFTLFGVTTTISLGGIVSFLAAVPALGWLAGQVLPLSLGQALLAGALAAGVMFASEWLHQMGHAYTAHRLGHPMRGIHFFSVLSVSLYPKDEPPLPRAIHVRRALGGFWVNILIGLLLVPYAFFLFLGGGVKGFVVGFAALYNLVVLGLGAFLPIDVPGVGSTDGGALLRYWRESQKR